MESREHLFRPAKLLISFVARHRGDMLVAATKAAGARGGTVVPGRALSGNRLLSALCLADIDEDIVFTIMGQEAEAVTRALEAAAGEEPKKLRGQAILLDVAGMLFRVPGCERDNAEEAGMPSSGHKLITVIVNHGCADDLMAAARGAGARGGTILTARGTGTENDVKFFGITLVPEKDMLMIVAEENAAPAILEAVSAMPGIQQPGGGIVYVMNIEKFMPLGRGAL